MSQTTALSAEALVLILDKKLEENLRPFLEVMDDIKKSVDFVSEKLDFLATRVLDVEKRCEEALTENKTLKAEILRLSNILQQQSEDISNIEQYSRYDSVEICGLPEESDDTNALTIKVGSFMGLKINESDISVMDCHQNVRPEVILQD